MARVLVLLLAASVLFAAGSAVYFYAFEPEEPPLPVISVRARHILVKTRGEAEKIMAELANGASFEELARNRSTDNSNKDRGGELGWFARTDMVAPFEHAAFSANKGELVGPVRTIHGYHIIKVEGKSSKDRSRRQ